MAVSNMESLYQSRSLLFSYLKFSRRFFRVSDQSPVDSCARGVCFLTAVLGTIVSLLNYKFRPGDVGLNVVNTIVFGSLLPLPWVRPAFFVKVYTISALYALTTYQVYVLTPNESPGAIVLLCTCIANIPHLFPRANLTDLIAKYTLLTLSILSVFVAFELQITQKLTRTAVPPQMQQRAANIALSMFLNGVSNVFYSWVNRVNEERLLEENEARLLFIGKTSHEVRNALCIVLGVLENLQADTDPMGEGAELIASGTNAGKHILQVMNDVLDSSKIDSQRMKLQMENMSIVEEVLNVTSQEHLVASQAKGRRLTVACHFTNDTPQQIRGDAFRVRQVLMNLVGNAIKFTSEGKICINVRGGALTDGRPAVEISIKDTGKGISPEALTKVFNRWEIVEEGAHADVRHTGLGLSIVKDLVELMEGEIFAASEGLGRGSAFTFRLPCEERPHPLIASPFSVDRGMFVWIDVRDPRNDAWKIIIRDYLVEWGVAHTTDILTHDRIRERRPLLLTDVDFTSLQLMMNDEEEDFRHFRSCCILVDIARRKQRERESTFGDFPIPVHTLQIPIKPLRLLELINEKKTSVSGGQMSVSEIETQMFRASASPSAPPCPEARILVVDDSEGVRSVLVRMLRGLGCIDIQEAASGEECIKIVNKTAKDGARFDTIFLDMELPGMSGVETSQRIRSIEGDNLFQRSYICALTGNVSEDSRVKCLTAGMDDYHIKPISRETVRQCLLRMSEMRIARSTTGATLNRPFGVHGDLTDECTSEFTGVRFYSTPGPS